MQLSGKVKEFEIQIYHVIKKVTKNFRFRHENVILDPDVFSNTKFKFAPKRDGKDEIAGLIKYSKREYVKRMYEKKEEEKNIGPHTFGSIVQRIITEHMIEEPLPYERKQMKSNVQIWKVGRSQMPVDRLTHKYNDHIHGINIYTQ